MTDLHGASPEQLRAELARRERPRPPTPQPLESPSFDALIHTCTESVAYAERDGYIDKNLKAYIFEAALEAVFGRSVWDWWNQQDQPG